MYTLHSCWTFLKLEQKSSDFQPSRHLSSLQKNPKKLDRWFNTFSRNELVADQMWCNSEFSSVFIKVSDIQRVISITKQNGDGQNGRRTKRCNANKYPLLLFVVIHYLSKRTRFSQLNHINNPLKRAGFHIWKLFLLCYKAVYNRAFEPGNQVKSWWQNNTINTFLVFFVSYTAFKGLKQQLDGVWVNRDVQKQIHRNFYFITFIFISAVSLFFLLEEEAAGGGSQLPRFGEESCGGV